MLPETIKRLGECLDTLVRRGFASTDSRVLLVNDGSTDRTWDIITETIEHDERFAGLCLDRNRGHQTALTEGLMCARDKRAVSVSIDADLQDDVNAIIEMAEKHAAGAHIVCGVRASRSTDTFLKRNTARAYYKIMHMLGSGLIYDHADFRLLDVDALDALALYHGDDLFLRGLITRLGYRCEVVTYDRAERFAGESKYTLRKMLKLAARGFASGRQRPLSVAREPYTHTKELIGL